MEASTEVYRTLRVVAASIDYWSMWARLMVRLTGERDLTSRTQRLSFWGGDRLVLIRIPRR